MKIVLSWLNDLAPVGDDADALAPQLTQLGMQVEEILHVGSTVAGVITAKVLRTERHPDAAKVHRVTDYGTHGLLDCDLPDGTRVKAMVTHPDQFRPGQGVDLKPRAVAAYRDNAQMFRGHA